MSSFFLAFRLGRFWHLTWRRKHLLCLAAFLLCWAKLSVRCLPFRRVAVFLGEQGYEAQQTPTADQQAWCKDWSWALGAVARRLPWTTTCLVQALAGQCGMRSCRISGTVYLGVATRQNSSDGLIDAHAWLCCGDMFLTGVHEAARFKPMVWFGTHWP
jgi:hypothetical protein